MPTSRFPSYGGQALIEGVVMRGSRVVSAAMRNPDGLIIIEQQLLSKIYQSSIKKIPFLRGLLILWDSLGLGMKFITISANIQTGEDEKLEGFPLYATIGISLAIGIALFAFVPAWLTSWAEGLLEINAWMGNLLEGIVRLIIVIAYIWGVGRMKEIKRVFAYHGAEHKTINAFEAGADLTPENVSTYPLEHPRCGTSFLLTLVVISILVFTLIGPLPLLWRISSRIVLLPFIISISYEYMRFTADHLDNNLIRWLTKPNLLLQRLTTREPTSDMLEVSIAAFNSMRLGEEEFQPS